MGHLANTLQSLRDFPSTLRAFLDDTPAEAFDWRPVSWEGIPSEMLTIRQQICHVRDIEIDGYIQRFESLLHEDDPFLPSIDGYELVESRRYDQTDIGTALDAFDRGRSHTMKLLDAITPSDLARSGTFEGYGPVTVQSVIHFLCSHDQQHLAGIQWLLGMQATAATVR
nr:DinB family protein [uncultured Dongia sp.]